MINYSGTKKKLSASHLSDIVPPGKYFEKSRTFSQCVFYADTSSVRFFNAWRCTIKENRINEEIRAKEIRVIDETGAMIGIMSVPEALDIADERKLDLVEVSPNAVPPVCRILDYGKFRYEAQKREKEARKKQKTIQIKEIRLSTFIEEHDIEVKASTACKFLNEGNKVKVMLRFRGREMGHTALGRDVMDKFAGLCAECGTVEKKPNLEGRSMVMFLAPKSTK
ncbi:MAG: translation initiation factor IF-3 [Eubacterium sp.]|jgi:translation initiation factor IF-3